MSPIIVFSVIALYFGVLFLISRITSRNAGVQTYFTGDHQSPWYAVAFGMIGASLSGITFISVPGEVGNSNFYYFQLVLGYLVGYFLIARILLPLYYKLNLISIYSYLGSRFGKYSHKTGSLLFLISQSIGASLRLFVVSVVLHLAFFQKYDVPFFVTVATTILLIWSYTNRAGIKTIVWTDIFQTTMMLLSVGVSIYIVKSELGFSFSGMINAVAESKYATVFNFDWFYEKNFYKQFITGIVVAIAMNGLDQNEMQKSLTCRNLKESQMNIYLYSVILVITNLIFLTLGVLLYLYIQKTGINWPVDAQGSFIDTDKIFPDLALNYFGIFAGIIFMLGIAAAAFSSADSAMTSLTTAVYTDFISVKDKTEAEKKRIRNRINIVVAFVLIGIIMIFKAVNNDSVINTVFTIAGYTYGPLLGLFSFGLFTGYSVKDQWVPFVAVLSPFLAYFVKIFSISWFNFHFGFTILLINGLITFFGLWMIRGREKVKI